MKSCARVLVPVLLVTLVVVTGCKKKTPPPVPQTAPPIAAPAPTASIAAQPTAISAGDQVTLVWKTTDATSVSIDGIGDVPTSGTKTVTPTTSTNYHLVAKGEGGTADATARVTVSAPPPVTQPTNTMSAEEEFKANMQDIFYDYDAYDVRPDAQTTLSKDAAFLNSHPNMRIVIGGIATNVARMNTTSVSGKIAPMLRKMHWSRRASLPAAFVLSATAKRSPSAPNRPKPAGSRTAAPASRWTSNTKAPVRLRRHRFNTMPPGTLNIGYFYRMARKNQVEFQAAQRTVVLV